MQKKKLKDRKGFKLIAGLFREGLQTLPVVGTIITNLKTDTTDNPAGKIKLSKWDIYRLIFGLIIGFILWKGILTMNQIEWIAELIKSF